MLGNPVFDSVAAMKVWRHILTHAHRAEGVRRLCVGKRAYDIHVKRGQFVFYNRLGLAKKLKMGQTTLHTQLRNIVAALDFVTLDVFKDFSVVTIGNISRMDNQTDNQTDNQNLLNTPKRTIKIISNHQKNQHTQKMVIFKTDNQNKAQKSRYKKKVSKEKHYHFIVTI